MPLMSRTGPLGLALVLAAPLAAYLSVDPVGTASRSAAAVHERIAPFLGALQLDRKAAERDELARRLRRHNWRE